MLNFVKFTSMCIYKSTIYDTLYEVGFQTIIEGIVTAWLIKETANKSTQ